MPLSYVAFQQQIFFSTVRITASRKRTKGSSIGTGFLVLAQLKEVGQILLLISNRHVFVSSRRVVELNFVRKDNADGQPDLTQIVPFSGNLNLVYHPDKRVDLACVNISAITHVQDLQPYFRNLTPELISTTDEDDLLPGNDVFFVGYPENRFDIQHNLPVLRKGTIASMPQIDFNGKKEFVIDAQVFPGSSGSPVFGIVGNQYRLLGVVAQSMIRNSELKIIPTAQKLGVQDFIGLGIVIKGSAVIELVNHALKKFERAMNNPQQQGS